MITAKPDHPLIVQSDRTVLLDVHSSMAEQARNRLAPFADLVKSPEHVHTYRLTPLSIWNACALGLTAADMVEVLVKFSKFPPPDLILADIGDMAGRFGCVSLDRVDDGLMLTVKDKPTAELLQREKIVAPWLKARLSPEAFSVDPAHRGVLKQALVQVGYPAQDRAGYSDGEALGISLRKKTRSGTPFSVRDYQRKAVNAFKGPDPNSGGSGVICLPCGAGKTIVGMGVISELKQTTLILTTNLTAVKQWRRELLDKTDVSEGAIAEYTGESKAVGPITLTTYQILTWRPNRKAEFPHFHLFYAQPWGLIIYDEVHLLPAPVFRVTAELQARRRLGMTATLIREDGREEDVFALIGPKRYDAPWRELEAGGWIARAVCNEIRLPMSQDLQMEYALASKRSRFRIAAENPVKIDGVHRILNSHPDAQILIIGEYLRQLQALATLLEFPLISGKMPSPEREQLYQRFRNGEVHSLILSRVGNFALDLPDADVLIQVSGIFGSRQEEAQRLGRILRPKSDGRQAYFYTLVSQHTREEDFARNRQLFLTEQGYSYELKFETDGG
jgi:DNA excision repair protein ERCC-3